MVRDMEFKIEEHNGEQYRGESFQIGWYVLEEDQTFRNSFECAAWHQDVKVKAGRYPLFGKFEFRENDRCWVSKINYMSVSCRLDGIVESSDFTSHFAGNAIGSKVDQDKGKAASYYINPYAHSVAHSIIKSDGNCSYQLLEEFEAKEIPFVYDGVEKVTYGIFKVSAK